VVMGLRVSREEELVVWTCPSTASGPTPSFCVVDRAGQGAPVSPLATVSDPFVRKSLREEGTRYNPPDTWSRGRRQLRSGALSATRRASRSHWRQPRCTKLEAIIRPEKLDEVKEALAQAGFVGLT